MMKSHVRFGPLHMAPKASLKSSLKMMKGSGASGGSSKMASKVRAISVVLPPPRPIVAPPLGFAPKPNRN